MTDSNSQLSALDTYFLELGRFVHQFSSLENLMQIYLTLQTAVGMDVARACFSGVKMDLAKSYIKRTREAQGFSEDDLLDRVFAQITVLTNARNDILHHGTNFESLDSPAGSVTNKNFAMPGREYEFPVSPQILRDLAADVNAVKNGIAFLMTRDTKMKGPPPEFWEPFERAARAPWRYTPPARPQTRQQRQKGDPKHPRQKKPSAENG